MYSPKYYHDKRKFGREQKIIKTRIEITEVELVEYSMESIRQTTGSSKE